MRANLSVACPDVPDDVLNPEKAWNAEGVKFDDEVTKLAKLFTEKYVPFESFCVFRSDDYSSFEKYSDQATEDVIKAGPSV